MGARLRRGGRAPERAAAPERAFRRRDRDGVCGDIDVCPYDLNDDVDGDGVCGDIDNCDSAPNPDQSDTDGDCTGDACDNCLNIPNPDQANLDKDMLGDACDDICSAPVALMERQLDASVRDVGKDVELGPQGSIYITAETEGNIYGVNKGSSDAVIVKYNSDGNIIWSRQFGSTNTELVEDIDVDASGNAYVVGHTWGDITITNYGGVDIFAAKYDTNGNQKWVKQINASSWDTGYGIAADNSGNVFITGYTQGYLGGNLQGHQDIYVIKFDTNGNQLWARQLGTSSKDMMLSADVDASGNVYLAGFTEGSIGGSNKGDSDLLVVKYSAVGTLQWTSQFGTSAGETATAIAVDPSGNSYVTGYSSGNFAGLSNGDQDIITLKLDTMGNLLWKKQYGSASPEIGNAISLDPAGNVYVAGTDVILISYDSYGNARFGTLLGNISLDMAYGVAADSAGNAYITGSSEGYINGQRNYCDDIFLMKAGGQCQ